MRLPRMLCVVACVIVCAACAAMIRRAVYVPDFEPVRLREPLRGVKVWVYVDPDGPEGPARGSWEPSVIDIPEGVYFVSDPKADEAQGFVR